jgi:hypothetical protein
MSCWNCKYYDDGTGFCSLDYCQRERDEQIEEEKADRDYDEYKHRLDD